MRIDILTLFPQMFQGPFSTGIFQRAIDRDLVSVSIHNIRDYTHDKHHTVDDYPQQVVQVGVWYQGLDNQEADWFFLKNIFSQVQSASQREAAGKGQQDYPHKSIFIFFQGAGKNQCREKTGME